MKCVQRWGKIETLEQIFSYVKTIKIIKQILLVACKPAKYDFVVVIHNSLSKRLQLSTLCASAVILHH